MPDFDGMDILFRWVPWVILILVLALVTLIGGIVVNGGLTCAV